MILRVILIAVIAGALAGLTATAFQAMRLTPLIIAAEAFEPADAADSADASHSEAEAWNAAYGLGRHLFTTLSNALTGVGFGLLLAAAVVMRGRPVDLKTGAWWGLAGFATFALAPAIGLPPELPGSQAADLLARQTWWLLAAAATGAGLSLIVFRRRPLPALAGIALLLVPHMLGAPHPERFGGSAPPELAASFAVLSLVASAAFWLVLGSAIGFLLARTDQSRAVGA